MRLSHPVRAALSSIFFLLIALPGVLLSQGAEPSKDEIIQRAWTAMPTRSASPCPSAER